MKTGNLKLVPIICIAIIGFLAIQSFSPKSENQSKSPEVTFAYLGEIRVFGGNYAPKGWMLCDGQLLDISENTALFSILGTSYGGDGRRTFGIPDLRGRTAVHSGLSKEAKEVKMGHKGNIGSGDFNNAGYLGVRYIICVKGIYPSRN